MSYSFRPGVRENVGLVIGLSGPSGGGKTYSAMRLAQGIVGPGKSFAVIDTEARRALHYADKFSFDHCELKPPFRPDAYSEALKAADAAGYGCILVDSMSHEWAGEGGVLEWQEAELERMAGQDWGKRERVKMAAWIKPKMAHKAMVQRFLQLRAHVIFCQRAEEKVEITRGDDGKQKIVPKGFQPVCAKDFMFEMTVSFLLTPDRPGIGQPIKLQEQHRALFPDGAQINETCGQRLAAWAAGGAGATAASTARPRWLNSDGRETTFTDADTMVRRVSAGLEKWPEEDARAARERNAAIMAELANAGHSEQMIALSEAFDRKLGVREGAVG